MPEEAGSPGVNPHSCTPQTTLQRGANGRFALTATSGAWIEADAEVFVPIEQ